MNTREHFERSLTQSIKHRIHEAHDPSEAVFMIDVLLTNAIMLVGVVERGCKGDKAISRIVDRSQQIVRMMEAGQNKAKNLGVPHVEGDPEP